MVYGCGVGAHISGRPVDGAELAGRALLLCRSSRLLSPTSHAHCTQSRARPHPKPSCTRLSSASWHFRHRKLKTHAAEPEATAEATPKSASHAWRPRALRPDRTARAFSPADLTMRLSLLDRQTCRSLCSLPSSSSAAQRRRAAQRARCSEPKSAPSYSCQSAAQTSITPAVKRRNTRSTRRSSYASPRSPFHASSTASAPTLLNALKDYSTEEGEHRDKSGKWGCSLQLRSA